MKLASNVTTWDLGHDLRLTAINDSDGVPVWITVVDQSLEQGHPDATLLDEVSAEDIERIAAAVQRLRGRSEPEHRQICPDHGYYIGRRPQHFRCPDCPVQDPEPDMERTVVAPQAVGDEVTP